MEPKVIMLETQEERWRFILRGMVALVLCCLMIVAAGNLQPPPAPSFDGRSFPFSGKPAEVADTGLAPEVQSSLDATEDVGLASQPAIEPDMVVTGKLSHYTPWAGGVNCLTFVNGECVSPTASGRDWREGLGQNWLACPQEFPFGTQFIIRGEVWECYDRGGKIVRTPTGAVWLDLLIDQPIAPYGHEEPVGVIYP